MEETKTTENKGRRSAILKVGLTALVLLYGIGGYNHLRWDDKCTKTDRSTKVYYATTLTGHDEYTKYDDGSVALKICPGIIECIYSSKKLYKDSDGDWKVDTIEELDPRGGFKTLHRGIDYESHKSEFNESDYRLAIGRRKYQLKHGQ